MCVENLRELISKRIVCTVQKDAAETFLDANKYMLFVVHCTNEPVHTHIGTWCPTAKTICYFHFFLFFRSLIHIFLSCECVHNMRSDHDRFGIFCCVFLLHFYVVLLKVCSFDPENTAITWDRRRKNKPSEERRLKENRLLIWITMPNYHHIHCTRFKIWHFAYTTFFRQRMKQHQHECRARL